MSEQAVTSLPCGLAQVLNTKRTYLNNREEIKAVRSALIEANVSFMGGVTSPSMYVPSLKRKFVPSWMCKPYHGHLLLPGEIARAELLTAFPGLRKVGNWRGNQIKLLNHRWPMFCQQEYRGEVVYIDLVSAYWQCYGRLWLDVGFPGGFGKLDLAQVASNLQYIKVARNAVIGMTRSTQITMQKGKRQIKLRSSNPFLSPPLWATVMGWLNELAYAAHAYGAIYVMMDGYLFPSGSNFHLFEEMLGYYGIEYHKRMGDGHIRGWGSWKIDGFKETGFYGKSAGGRVAHIAPPWPNKTKTLDLWVQALEERYRRFINGSIRTA
jgi:hypothetical protein